MSDTTPTEHEQTEQMTTEQNRQLAVQGGTSGQLAAYQPLHPAQIVEQTALVRQVMEQVMQDGVHFGVIPGTPKPSLWQPGAQKLGLVFHLAPRFRITKTDLPNEHREYEIVCELVHQSSGVFVAEGVGSCTTRESKYRYRKEQGSWKDTQQAVPGSFWNLKTQADKLRLLRTIMDSHAGNYWVKKITASGEEAPRHSDTPAEWHIVEILGDGDQVENPNIADCYNTVLKIAKKRALVDATLNATAAGDVFTQDLEDLKDNLETLSEATGRNFAIEGAVGETGKAAQETQQTDKTDTKAKGKSASKDKPVSKTKATNSADRWAKIAAIPVQDWRTVPVHIRSNIQGKQLGHVPPALFPVMKAKFLEKYLPDEEWDLLEPKDRVLAAAMYQGCLYHGIDMRTADEQRQEPATNSADTPTETPEDKATAGKAVPLDEKPSTDTSEKQTPTSEAARPRSGVADPSSESPFASDTPETKPKQAKEPEEKPAPAGKEAFPADNINSLRKELKKRSATEQQFLMECTTRDLLKHNGQDFKATKLEDCPDEWLAEAAAQAAAMLDTFGYAEKTTQKPRKPRTTK